MNTQLVELLAWIQVELETPKPNISEIRKALEAAMDGTAKVLIDRDMIAESRRRIAMVAGCDNPLGEMRSILGGRE